MKALRILTDSFIILILIIMAGAVAVSCADSGRYDNARAIVINEVMADNRTGIAPAPGTTPADWIELKNTGSDTINLQGFSLNVIKNLPDSIAESMVDDQEMSWSFPDVSLIGGEYLLVVAAKEKDMQKAAGQSNDKSGQPTILVSDLKLPKAGATIQFIAPNGNVISEMTYGRMQADMALCLQPDSTYSPTLFPSPGFDNTRRGYEMGMLAADNQRRDPLRIWEVMSRAPHSYDNWVELKNTGKSDLDLSDYQLSKKLGKKEGWTLPKRTLKPGETITIQLAGKHKNPYNSLQAPFKLGAAESIVLSKKGVFVDGVSARLTPYATSIGRMDGRKGYYFFPKPTRNAPNKEDGRRFIAEMPAFNLKPGVYPGKDSLCLRLTDRKQRVRYTLDGSEPSASSPLMPDSLTITRTTVVRAYAEGDSVNLKSPLATASYLLAADHKIPVMNVSLPRRDLYDYNKGIYADGPEYGEEWPHYGANFWEKWTKKAHVELFDGKSGFSTDCGLAIFGGFSRNEPKKSFRLKFRSAYGNPSVDYDFFGNGNPVELEDLVLRSGSQDYDRCMLRDEFFTSLMAKESPTLLTQMYRPIALYLNGEYFGLYYMREKIDPEFVARKLGVSNDSVDIVMSKYFEEGDGVDYRALMKYLSTHDMRDSKAYEHVKKNVDLQGLIDFKLGELYAGNTDVGNVRYVRSTDPGADHRWRFVYYDLDATWVGYKPEAAYYLSTSGVAREKNVAVHNLMISRLLENKDFRKLFLERLSHHLATTFSEKNATAVFDALVEEIRPEMKRNCERWPELSYEQWEKNLKAFRVKFKDKPRIMLKDIRSLLKVTPEEDKHYFSKLKL